MKNLVLFFLSICFSYLTKAQKCNPCDLNKKVTISEQIQKFTYAEIQDFLCTFNSVCKNNVEFREVGNERLFRVIYAYPSVFTQVLESIEEEKQKLILNELSAPINDFDLKSILDRLQKIETKSIMLSMEIDAIKIAIDRSETKK